MNIEGLGEKAVKALVNQGFVTTVTDLYGLDMSTLTSVTLGLSTSGKPIEIGETRARKILAEIERSKRNEMWRLLFGLGIRHVGEGAARALADRCGSLERLVAASEKELESIPDVGPTVVQSLRTYFDQPETIGLLKALRAAGVNPSDQIDRLDVEPGLGVLTGQSFVLTGSLTSLSRSEAKKAIESLGGKVVSSVSQHTSYVVMGENPGRKLLKAKELGIKRLTGKEFLALLSSK